MNVPILLLRDGTEQSQGKRQIISNITACQAVADSVRTTLGPRGMDKLIADQSGKVTISNDGATILKLLDVAYPAAKVLVDIAKSQDAEVGDGTTSVVILASELLKNAKPFVEEGVHPQVIVRAYRKAAKIASDKLNEEAVRVNHDDKKAQYETLMNCAKTSLSSKLLATQKDVFAKIAVDAVLSLDSKRRDMNLIGIKKVHGGSMQDSKLVEGIAFKKTFSYAGFEMQPKEFDNPAIALLNIELELKAEKENAECRIDNVEDYQQMVDAEWTILYDKLQKIHDAGAKIVFSKLPIGDVATQWFADRDMFCAGRVPEDDMRRVTAACGGTILSSVTHVNPATFGSCKRFEEMQVGNERFTFLTGGRKAHACTIVLRGGAEQFIDEAERSLHDALLVVRRGLAQDSFVAGGGAIDMMLSKHLRQISRSIAGREQLLMAAFARAFEVIPQQLCHNAGLDATDLLNRLRQKHALGEKWTGIDLQTEELADTMVRCVWEPAQVKSNAINAATEAACLVLSVDQTVKNPKAQNSIGQ